MSKVVSTGFWLALALLGCTGEVGSDTAASTAGVWTMHTVAPGVAGSGYLDGADGVDLRDINNDGLLDVTSGAETGHRVSISVHPGYGAASLPWPTTLAPSSTVSGVEDSVFGDIDQDGIQDVLVGAEGSQRVVLLYGPGYTRVDLIQPKQRSMRVALADLNGDGIPELVVGGKAGNLPATLGYFTLTGNPRLAEGWTYTPITAVGWVMQMLVLDFDLDGDTDIVYTDKVRASSGVTSNRGLRWYENSGGNTPTWTLHQISPIEDNHKWFDLLDWDSDGDYDVIDCRSNPSGSVNAIKVWLNGATWIALPVAVPSGVGSCQHATALDIDVDGATDIGVTATLGTTNIYWIRNTGSNCAPSWSAETISSVGDKYDNLAWYDVDGDGDQDAVTSEQNTDTDNDLDSGPGLGVVWFENPLY